MTRTMMPANDYIHTPFKFFYYNDVMLMMRCLGPLIYFSPNLLLICVMRHAAFSAAQAAAFGVLRAHRRLGEGRQAGGRALTACAVALQVRSRFLSLWAQSSKSLCPHLS